MSRPKQNIACGFYPYNICSDPNKALMTFLINFVPPKKSLPCDFSSYNLCFDPNKTYILTFIPITFVQTQSLACEFSSCELFYDPYKTNCVTFPLITFLPTQINLPYDIFFSFSLSGLYCSDFPIFFLWNVRVRLKQTEHY